MFCIDFFRHFQPFANRIINFKNRIWIFIIFRLFNVLFIQTTFVPDEYFQSIEVAHYWVFGYGHLSWEWESCISLRSVIHPFMFAVLYYILKITNLDYPILVLYVPKIFQGLCAAFCDLGFLKLVMLWYCQLYKNTVKNNKNLICIILACHLFCWFHFYTICRTTSNAFECLFGVWGLYFLSKNYVPFQKKKKNNGSGKIQDMYKSSNRENNYVEDSVNGTNDGSVPSRKVQGIKSEHALHKSAKGKNTSYKNNIKKRKDTNSSNASSYSETAEVASGRSDMDHMEEPCIDFSKKENGNEGLHKWKEVKCQHGKNLLYSLFFSSLCTALKPNAVVFWLVLYFFYLIRTFNKDSILSYGKVITIGLFYAISFLLFIICIDSYYYGKISVVFFNFFYFNIIGNAGTFFGTNPFHYYFTQGLSVVYLTFIPFTYYGIIYVCIRLGKTGADIPIRAFLSRIDVATFIASFVEVIALSFSKHKEHKMLTGYIPFFTILTGFFLHKFRCYLENIVKEKTNGSKKEKGKGNQKRNLNRNQNPKRILNIFFFFVNISFFLQLVFIIYFSLFHQGAPEKVSTYFRNLKVENGIKDEDIYVFNVDCYDIPLYSHIHRRFKIGFLDCSPSVKNGKIVKNWRAIMNENNFGSDFYNLFDNTQNTVSQYIIPYTLPGKNFHWFGSTNYNPKQAFQFVFNELNFSCLDYRFFIPLRGELPTYLIADSFRLKYLKWFLEKFNYRPVAKPYFHNVNMEEENGKKTIFFNYYHIFKKE